MVREEDQRDINGRDLWLGGEELGLVVERNKSRMWAHVVGAWRLVIGPKPW